MEISAVSQHGDQEKTGKNNYTAAVCTPVQCSNCMVVSVSCHIFFCKPLLSSAKSISVFCMYSIFCTLVTGIFRKKRYLNKPLKYGKYYTIGSNYTDYFYNLSDLVAILIYHTG